ncbi:hypothetical protein BZA77DRAFT_362542 [Pyronema omphalodes]|nr:hypothetical protein BZA77DRAFT_362542 [Pyronema omphalodes]
MTDSTRSQHNTGPAETVPTEREVARPYANKGSGDAVPEQPIPEEDGTTSSASQAKCNRRKAKKKKKKKKISCSTSATSLSTCPPEVLNSIIGFLRGPDDENCTPDLLNLRLVSRGLRYFLQPIVYESVRIPRKDSDNPAVTKDVRELLRLIDLNPSLATSIQHLTYRETHPDNSITMLYSLEELKHDHKIYTEFTQQMDPDTRIDQTFQYSSTPSQLRKVSLEYEHICTPLLLARLINLRELIFHGYVGGRYAYLLTTWAHEIWTRTALTSLEMLFWHPLDEDSNYQRMQWFAYDRHRCKSAINRANPIHNEWHIVSFLNYTPGLQNLTIIEDTGLARATPHSMPIMRFLTSLCIQSVYSKNASQCILELLQCSPTLTELETLDFEAFQASDMRKALGLVRNTIEVIHIDGEFEAISTNGGIGPFQDFPKLREISIDLASLVPISPKGWPQRFCLLQLLPPNLESLNLYLYDPDSLLSTCRRKNNDDTCPFDQFEESIRRPYMWLEGVALAKESGSLSNLRSISIDDECWKLLLNQSLEEGPEKLAAICARLGISWEWCDGSVPDPWETESDSDTDSDTDSETDSDPEFGTIWEIRYAKH